MITICLLSAMIFSMQEVESQPEREWRTPNEISSQITHLSESYEAVTTTIIGYSGNGLPIQCMQIARVGDIPVDERSAILLVAGIDGDHLLGTEVALDIVTSVLAADSEKFEPLLETHKLYVIPQVNPDAASYYFNPVQTQRRRNVTPADNDHDGVIDEDGTEDLNGDGLITMMRVPDLEKATHLANPDLPRLNITPKPLEGKVASFVLYSEGIDNDGDGDYNEDGLGGVDLNKNFMHGYQFHGDGAGHWQLSESESKALADFVLTHQEIAAIIVYGQHDTLSKPFVENGKDKAGAPQKLAEDDVEMYKIISEKFVELTELKEVEQPNWDGSFIAWAYAQYGVPSFSTPLWSRPIIEDTNQDGKETKGSDELSEDTTEETDLTPSGVGDISQETMDELFQAAVAAGYIDGGEASSEMTPTVEEAEMYCKMMGIDIRRVQSKKGSNKASSADAKWLEYSDAVREGTGFVDWTPFEHPQLGQIEIGGWVPYFKTLPPTNAIDAITEKQVSFLVDTASRLPKVRLSTPSIEKLGNGLWEVKVAVINDGWFPTGTAMAKKNKRARPFVVRLGVPNKSIVSGRKVNLIWALDGKGTRQWYKWILQGNQNEKIDLTLYSEKFGTKTISTVLKETKGDGA
ncbi:MAG: hypothetical protein H8E86_08850 [Planctomycetes bacterium]|nr:hypothetical protein [Planctomycetota bacterium]